MKRRNKVGPNIDPWDTPEFIIAIQKGQRHMQ